MSMESMLQTLIAAKTLTLLYKSPEARDNFEKNLLKTFNFIGRHGHKLIRVALYGGVGYLGWRAYQPLGLEAQTLGALSGMVALEAIRSMNPLVSTPALVYLTGLGLIPAAGAWLEEQKRVIQAVAEETGLTYHEVLLYGVDAARAIAKTREIAEAPEEDRPHYYEWVMAQVTGSTVKGYCEWMLEFHPDVKPKVCEK